MTVESYLVYPDADTLAQASAGKLAALAREAVETRGIFTLSLAGGSTPKRLYGLLATEPAYHDLPWNRMHLFFGDERHVPPDHIDSNYHMAQTTLLVSGLVPSENVHRVEAELPDAAQAAADYEVKLRTVFTEAMQLNGVPRFDLILLGMGPDGHTASLFPGSPGLEEKTKWVMANPVEKFKSDRITFTYPILNAARAVHLLVAGSDKAEMISRVLDTAKGSGEYPVQRVAPIDGTKTWLLDRAAAALLPQAAEAMSP